MSRGCETVGSPSCKNECNKKKCDKTDYGEVVACFSKNYSDSGRKMLAYFKSISFGKVFDCTTQMGRIEHPQRIPKNSLKEFFEKLLAKENDLKRCRNFEELKVAVEQEKVTGIGILSIYDTAFRIGAHLGIYPDKIYLHSGTLEGAKIFGFKREKSLFKEQLPDPFQRLEPYEIEDCLCICRDVLSRIAQKEK